MKLLRMLVLPAVAIVAGLTVTSASAAPMGNALGELRTLPEAQSAVDQAYWVRKCYRGRYGRIFCHKVWVSPRRHYRRW